MNDTTLTALETVQLPISTIEKESRDTFIESLLHIATEHSPNLAFSSLDSAFEKNLEPALAAVATDKLARKTGLYQQGSELLKRIFEKNQSDTYVAYFYGSCLFANGQFNELSLLASHTRQLCLSSPVPEVTRSRWGTLLLEAGIFSEADYFISSLSPSKVQQTLQNRLNSFSLFNRGSSLPVFILNLRKDARKKHISSTTLTSGGYQNFNFVPAVEAAYLPEIVLDRTLAEPDVLKKFGRGAIGCWLSHMLAWEHASKSTAPWVLVLEDDAIPEFHASALEQLLENLSHCDQDYNFVWLNERMSGKSQGISDQLKPVPVDPWELLSLWSDKRTAIGADAYMLTPNAARRLLDHANKVGICGHVDGFLTAWTMEQKKAPVNRIQRLIVDFQINFGFCPEIKSTALSVPLFKEQNFGFSSR
ncbi:glycosyltransferase family 25 protein [uncultured Corynebacterium sp.]|uniref:glycosyltransferase family 25 protein n=1 Tax=uncultured Corynebacterium sp. TaxID=159447 RepID=UPI0028061D6D|nr:glycosyltransferase family 25 protein [uncultured Corynebacterium sp.]